MTTHTALIDELRELFGRTAYSHKTHEKMADHLEWWHRCWFWADVLLIAVSATGLIAHTIAALPFSFFNLPFFASVVPAIASTAALFVTLYIQRSDADRRIVKHREAATELWFIREQLVSILSDLKDDALTVDLARQRRDEILDRLKDVYRVAPRTDGKAYAKAQKALKVDQDLTFSDQELNVMLPKSLQQGRLDKPL